jgi:cyclic pyranopterin phosphate synthase
LNLSHVEVEIETSKTGLEVTCAARTIGQTGVEMEALTGTAVALLTIYDMCKAVDKDMRIGEIRLVQKTKTRIRQD